MLARTAHALMAVLALIAAYLQLNDPDPTRWVALYLGCSLVACLYAATRPSRPLALGMALVSLAWAAAIVPELIGRWKPGQLFESMAESRPELEYGREFGGLCIVATYCALSYFLARRRPESAQPGV